MPFFLFAGLSSFSILFLSGLALSWSKFSGCFVLAIWAPQWLTFVILPSQSLLLMSTVDYVIEPLDDIGNPTFVGLQRRRNLLPLGNTRGRALLQSKNERLFPLSTSVLFKNFDPYSLVAKIKTQKDCIVCFAKLVYWYIFCFYAVRLLKFLIALYVSRKSFRQLIVVAFSH